MRQQDGQGFNRSTKASPLSPRRQQRGQYSTSVAAIVPVLLYGNYCCKIWWGLHVLSHAHEGKHVNNVEGKGCLQCKVSLIVETRGSDPPPSLSDSQTLSLVEHTSKCGPCRVEVVLLYPFWIIQIWLIPWCRPQ